MMNPNFSLPPTAESAEAGSPFAVVLASLEVQGDPSLTSALREIPPAQAVTIILHHIYGMPYDNIAQLFDIDPDEAREHSTAGMAALIQQSGI